MPTAGTFFREDFWTFLASGKLIFTTERPVFCAAIRVDSFEEVCDELDVEVEDPERIERWESSGKYLVISFMFG